MAEGTEKQVGTNKTAENLLSILGAVGQVAGPLIFGPDFQGNLGAPFQAAAMQAQSSRMSKGIEDAMKTHPETKALLDDIASTHAQGGLMNALSSQGQSFGPVAPQGMSGLPTGGSPTVITPQMTPMTPTEQAPQQAPQQYAQSMDFTSPEAIARFARVDPKLAEALILKSAGQSEGDPISRALAMMKLRDYESPEQKRMRDAQARLDVNTETGANEIAKKQAIERSKPVATKVQQDLRATDSMDITLGQFRDQFSTPRFQNRTGSQLAEDFAKLYAAEKNDAARGALATKDPELAKIAPLFYKIQADYAKSISGAAISEQEFKRLAQVMPRIVDSPEKINSMLNNFGEINRYLKLSMAAANRANDIEALGFDREEVEDFRAAQTLLRKQGKLSDREKQLLTATLSGLNLGNLASYSNLD